MRTAIFVAALLAALPAYSGTITGVAVGVHDGDTATILSAGGPVHVRLADIDAPELNQPFGYRSKQALSAMIYGKTVTVDENGDVSYRRPIGTIYVDGKDANEAMVSEGMAWVYTRYQHDPAMTGLEASARARGAGLWGLQADQRIPPWEWRREARHKHWQ